MKQKIVNNLCDRLLTLKELLTLYYSLNEEHEFKIWLQQHAHKHELESFFDQLHETMPKELSAALTPLFDGNPEHCKKILTKNRKLFDFLSEHLYTPELFNEEWNIYIRDESNQYIHIILTPDNDINSILNDDNDDKTIRFKPSRILPKNDNEE